MAALQSRWSHWMRSPGRTSHSAAPLSASRPFTQKNQSACPPAPSPFTPSIDWTKRPPKRVVTSNSERSMRITV